MKATLSLEYIGESEDARKVLCSRRLDQMEPGLGRAVIGTTRPRVPWVAKIEGGCPRFGWRRSFLSANWQRKNANSQHSRGVMLWFVLEDGYIYEVKHPISWRRSDRYFCRVTEGGDIEKLSEAEVQKCLSGISG